jgi:hypothetical protein
VWNGDKNILLPELKEKENVLMEIDDPSAEAEKEMYLRLPIPEKFIYHKEGEATLRRFLHLYEVPQNPRRQLLTKVGWATFPT